MTEVAVRDFSFRGNTFKVACHETSPQNSSWFTFVDEQEVRDRDWTVSPGDYVLDIGAAYGSYALSALSAGASFVWAWSPQTFDGANEKELFEASLALNAWSGRCRVFDSGIYDRTGWLNVSTQEFSEVEVPAAPDVIRVETMGEWEARERPKRVDWVKLDVEGAEVEVLKSAEGLIRRFQPKICLENHVFKRASIEQEVRDLLTSYGYTEIRTVPYHSVSHSLYLP
jgi:FkbM family methyltransferase